MDAESPALQLQVPFLGPHDNGQTLQGTGTRTRISGKFPRLFMHKMFENHGP